MEEVKDLTKTFQPDLVIIESGGDNLAANYSRELADYIIYVIDVAGLFKTPSFQATAPPKKEKKCHSDYCEVL